MDYQIDVEIDIISSISGTKSSRFEDEIYLLDDPFLNGASYNESFIQMLRVTHQWFQTLSTQWNHPRPAQLPQMFVFSFIPEVRPPAPHLHIPGALTREAHDRSAPNPTMAAIHTVLVYCLLASVSLVASPLVIAWAAQLLRQVQDGVVSVTSLLNQSIPGIL